jgi:subtilisin family serine protease
MKRLILGSLVVAAVLLTGCGGGGGSSAPAGGSTGGDNNGTVTPPVTNAVYSEQLPNVPLYPNSTDSTEPFYSAQWYLEYNKEYYDAQSIDVNASIHGHDALRKYDGSGVVVGVMDSGYEIDHEELINMHIEGKFKVVPASEDRTDISPIGDLNHGTSVLGLMAAQENSIGIKGIAPEASYWLGASALVSNSSDMEDAFRDMNASRVSVFSESREPFGDLGVESTFTLIKELVIKGKGIVFVYGAGNDNENVEYYLDRAKYVLVVGATDTNNVRAPYSNYGKLIDIVAPGGNGNLLTVDRTGDAGYTNTAYDAQFAGTSAATPIVAGAIALARQARPDLNATVIMDLVRITADKIGSEPYSDCGALGCRNDTYGYGKLNLDKFVEAVENY